MRYTEKMINVWDHGLVPDGTRMNTEALQSLIDRIAEEQGGTLYFPPGTYLCGSIRLRSDITMILDKGAILLGSPNAEDMRFFETSYQSRMDHRPWKAFLFAENERNITICGEGTIDGNGGAKDYQDHIGNSPNRPYGLHLIGCKHLRIEGITLRNSGFWMQRYLYCEDIRISGISVWNHCNMNNDGIDIDSCEDVIITDSIIDSEDDAICIKSEGYRPAKNICISNCIAASHASGFKLGTASIGGFENITFTGSTIRSSRYDSMIHELNAKGGLTAIDLGNVDGGTMRNILISNIAIDGPETVIFVKNGRRLSSNVEWQGNDNETQENNTTNAGNNCISENILIRGISAINAGPYPSIIQGFADHPVRNICLRDIYISCSRSGTESDLGMEPNWNPESYPNARWTAGDGHMPVFGIHIYEADDVILDNIRIEAAPGEPRPGLKIERTNNLEKRMVRV